MCFLLKSFLLKRMCAPPTTRARRRSATSIFLKVERFFLGSSGVSDVSSNVRIGSGVSSFIVVLLSAMAKVLNPGTVLWKRIMPFSKLRSRAGYAFHVASSCLRRTTSSACALCWLSQRSLMRKVIIPLVTSLSSKFLVSTLKYL